MAFKGRTLERNLLTEMNLPWLDLEKLDCPKFKDVTWLSTIKSCGYQQDPWHHHCEHIKCYHLGTHPTGTWARFEHCEGRTHVTFFEIENNFLKKKYVWPVVVYESPAEVTKSITLVMTQLTLLSDASKEFLDNTSSAFNI